MSNMSEANAKQRMLKSIEVLQQEFARLRTGRAHPSLLEHIMVDSYGSEVPLNQVASVTIADPRTLLITPWDKNVVAAVEKAIVNANLGLNPMTAGQAIRVPMPPLTEERRKQMIKVVRSEAETARISIRNVRRDFNQHVKNDLKNKEISEDEQKRLENTIQKLTDQFIKDVDGLLKAKEADLLEI